MLELIRGANLALRFLLELCALGALGYWGFKTGGGLIAKIGLGIGAPLIAAVVWGTFLSPQAPVRLPGLLVLILQALVFGLAAAGLVATGHQTLALVFVVIVTINAVLMYLWGNDKLVAHTVEEVLVGRDRSVSGKDAQDLLCVINDQGDVALTGVEASLAVRDGLGQVACYLTSVDLCLLAPPPLSTPNGGRYHCSGSECKEGNRSCAHAQAVCPEHGFRQRLLGVRRARSIQKRYRARISIDLNTLA